MANDSPAPTRSGLSLYANLLNPKSAGPGTISSAPVSYAPAAESQELDEAAKKQQALAGTELAVAAQKAKAKAIAAKFAPPTAAPAVPAPATTSAATDSSNLEPSAAPATAPKTTIADWAATASDDDDVNNFYGEKRQRGGRKKRKKNNGGGNRSAQATTNWDDIYDPSRPNNYEDYKHSEEKIREVREWKDLLYRHRMKRRESSLSESDDDRRPRNKQFAPPMSFAPPANINDEPSSPPPPPPPLAEVPDDPTGEDAYLRRLRMSQPEAAHATPPPPPPPEPAPPPPGQISREPVRYNLPPPPEDIPASEMELEEKLADADVPEENAEQPRSNRPGQAGFAERLLAKYGWTKGQGLGAQGSGITTALYAKADKRKKKSDAEGGGYVTPATTGKILGGTRAKGAQGEEGKFGAMSEVIRLEGMLDGLDLDEELARGEGGIMQEIGEECGDKYGSVERVYIHRPEEDDPVVFVSFVSQLSALRAVNALEGRIFNGNPIKARFWQKEKFEGGQYS